MKREIKHFGIPKAASPANAIASLDKEPECNSPEFDVDEPDDGISRHPPPMAALSKI